MEKREKKKPEAALDHDMKPDLKIVPFGVFEPLNYNISIVFGTSNETTNFVVDGL